MPSIISSIVAACAIGASAVNAHYYGTASGAPHATATYGAPYGNGSHPYQPHPTGGNGYFTTTVCETKTTTDSYGHATTITVDLYTTYCPYTTSTIYSETVTSSAGTTYTETYAAGTTVYPVTTFYPHTTVETAAPTAPAPVVPAPVVPATGTGVMPPKPTYTGAASALKVSGGLAAAVAVAALVM